MRLWHLQVHIFWSSYFPSESTQEADLQRRHLIITLPPSATPRPCHFMMPAYGCHNLLSSPWALLLSLRHPAASASCMTACFPAATLVTAYRWRRGACFTNDACSTGASWGWRRRQRESVQHACYCWLSHPLMYPPARRQCAIHSAVIQSCALARQMVLAIHCPALGWSASKLKAPFSSRNKGLVVLLSIFYCHCWRASTLCWFQVEPKPQWQRRNPCQSAAPKRSLAEQMPVVVLWAVMNWNTAFSAAG